ncbi:MAG: hypothetical protein GY862_04155 [Gammaproteobacteria bacterium]|nr:hypothetical protein [Gammaproteobacteria bacterium]
MPWLITPKHSGDLGVATKEPRKGRPAAIGRELLRLVKYRVQADNPSLQ